jgi:hypothetical protein
MSGKRPNTNRTAFGWQIDHFLGYFAVILLVCLAWPRPCQDLWSRKHSVGLAHQPIGDEADPLLRGPVELDQR